MAEDRIVFRLEPELRERAQAAAIAEGRSLSNFTRRALEEALGNRGGPPLRREPLDEAGVKHGRAPASSRAPAWSSAKANVQPIPKS